ncbi:MAG: TraR/DksA C4-type zinc finger protein [Gemmataceae bacterium]|nr:TraR/DksA C4-type zinc finger protein [Gemmataceae bacterium]
MTSTQKRKYRDLLEKMGGRVRETAAGLEEQVRTPTGGESAGSLSNVPMHLGDVGSEVYNQELNATLLENEAHIRDEVYAALDRLDAGTFGACERCGKAISAERLDALPYARHCVGCAAEVQAGAAVNFNAGRPEGFGQTFGQADTGTGAEPSAGRKRGNGPTLFTDLERDDGGAEADTHAAGTPGGGTAVGGLAGTNLGRGDPADAGLEHAMGSGNFDVAEEGEDEDVEAYSGASGGAVGGTPANKRAVGGKKRGGTAPKPGKGDGPTGQ